MNEGWEPPPASGWVLRISNELEALIADDKPHWTDRLDDDTTNMIVTWSLFVGIWVIWTLLRLLGVPRLWAGALLVPGMWIYPFITMLWIRAGNALDWYTPRRKPDG